MKKIFTLNILSFLFCGLFAQDTTHHSIVITSKLSNRVRIDETYNYLIEAIDSANKQLTFSVDPLPGWLTYNGNAHTISGKAAKTGQYPVHIVITDGKDTIHQRYMLTVFDNQTTNILCLGNSITNGTGKYNSYRRDLWQMLHKANYNFDFIGSWDKHHMGGAVPIPDFDMDHEGHSGWTFEDMFHPPDWDSTRGNINVWLQQYVPDIVLIELGTNDVFHCRKTKDIIKDLGSLVETLRNKNNRVKIFVAQIPPLGAQWAPKKLCGNDTTYNSRILELNNAIAVFVKENNNDRSRITKVDQFSHVDPATMMYDDIHPNDTGEKIMAERWFNAIQHYLKKLRND